MVVANRHTDTQIEFHLCSEVAAADGRNGATRTDTRGNDSEDAIVTYPKNKPHSSRRACWSKESGNDLV